jgi:hypothetical protein
MKAVKISNIRASVRFGTLLMAENIKFYHEYGDFYIFNTANVEEFTKFVKKEGAYESGMVIEQVEFNL